MAHCRGIRAAILQKALIPVLGGALAGVFLANTAQAAVFDLKDRTYPPATFQNVQQSVNALQSYVGQAQCGGWNFDKSAENAIANVSGLPGREGDPFGLITLGMAKREETGQLLDDGYQFPDRYDVRGWTTACRPGSPPYYVDTSSKTPCANPDECQKLCVAINRWQRPVWQCMCPDDSEQGYHMEGCSGRCGQHAGAKLPGVSYTENPNGSVLYYRKNNLNAPDKDQEPDCKAEKEGKGCSCAFVGWFYCCTNVLVTKLEYEACNEGGAACLSHPDANRNCLRCEGDGAAVEQPDPPAAAVPATDFHGNRLGRMPDGNFNETGCRVGRAPAWAQVPVSDITEGPELPNGKKRKYIQPRQYISFYRHYTSASYTRDAITPEVKKDNNTESGIPVRCYGRYSEFDPRLRIVMRKDKHCVIDISRNRDISIERMRTSQIGKGETAEDMDFSDPAFEKEPQEGEMTIWRNDLKEDGKPDDVHLLEMPSKYQRATVQMTEEEPVSSGSLIRAFDETVATDPIEPEKSNLKRTLVEWWQEQQTEGNKIFTPPVLRIVVPPAWSIDLDPLQPIFITKPAEEEMAEWKENTLLQPIEIQLELREDLLGEIAQFLEKSLLLQIEQERVPIAVPLGSATELRALREGWCHWYKFQNKEESCENASGDLKKLLDRLAEYADRIDDYRKLRAELSSYLGEYLKIHNEINEHVGKWALNNMETFFVWQETRNSQAMVDLKTEWEKVQAEYRRFHDDTNFQWCRNDRFTTPIYSLLDTWMPGRPDLRNEALLPNGSPDEAKRLPTIRGMLSPDLAFDLTRLHLATGAIAIPVLEPIQVSYNADALRPPSDHNPNPPFPKLMELPPIPSIAENIGEKVPQVEVGKNLPPLVQTPNWPIDVAKTKEQMVKIREVIKKMDEEYAIFWNTLHEVKDQKELDCKSPNSGRCRHVEVDLIERFTRIGARPAVLLKEDFLSIGEFRKPLECPKEDWACVLLNPQKTFAKAGWEIRYPPEDEQEKFIGRLRGEMIEKSLTRSINLQSPPAEVIVSFDIPVEIVLLFTPPKEK
ncbi:MAG: hypothetical protein PHO92_03910 [Candidatus Peribacteraceae bacterium]|nr:hypothetical protein [Candidatus Peribacteraceae bacterium]